MFPGGILLMISNHLPFIYGLPSADQFDVFLPCTDQELSFMISLRKCLHAGWVLRWFPSSHIPVRITATIRTSSHLSNCQ
jgi:hypothetical protein